MELLPSGFKMDFKPPVSPCGVLILDGNRSVRGYVMYHLDTDTGLPWVVDTNPDPEVNKLFIDWLIPTVTQHLEWKNGFYKCTQGGKQPELPCGTKDCLCSSTTVVEVPIECIESRGQLSLYGHHWMQRVNVAFVEGKLVEFSNDEVIDSGKNWKKSWTSSHPSFQRLASVKGNNLSPVVEPSEEGLGFSWNKLPLEVYETLVKYLDGISLMNLCHTSSLIAGMVLEPFSVMSFQKRQLHWHTFCVDNLDRECMGKIVSGLMNFYEVNKEMLKTDGRIECLIAWEDVFKTYQSFWYVVANADVRIWRLNELENKIKSQILLMRQHTTSKNTMFGNVCLIRAGGGGILLSIMFPCILSHESKQSEVNMMVVDEMGSAGCVNFSSICTDTTVIFGLKVVYFPRIRRSNNMFYMDRVLVSVCNKCITAVSIFSDFRSKVIWDEEDDGTVHNDCPIFETYKNIAVLWHHPKSIRFFILAFGSSDDRFDLSHIYRLQFKAMTDVWKHIVQYRSYYISEVREYKGDTELMNEFKKNLVMGDSGYMYCLLEPTFYGLTLISPIYGVESFKPKLATESLDVCNTTVETFEPQYYSNNARRYIAGIREPTCSGKGHGMYVFCSNTTIAASWDCISWVFGPLKFPNIGKARATNVTHVDVMNHNNGLLLIINEDILVLDVILKDVAYWDGIAPEPELEVRLLRVFQTGIEAMYREITHCEVNFDEGQPFLLLVSERKSKRKDKFGVIQNMRDELSFVIKRIDFVI